MLTCAERLQQDHTDASSHAAVANPGSAYGASALGPSAGGATAGAPANPDAQAGTAPEPMPSQPITDGRVFWAATSCWKQGQHFVWLWQCWGYNFVVNSRPDHSLSDKGWTLPAVSADSKH